MTTIATRQGIGFAQPFHPVLYLPNFGDGSDALNTILRGYNAPVPMKIPWIALAPTHLYLPNNTTYIPIWAKVGPNVNITHMWVRIIPPYWVPPSPTPPDINGSQIVQDDRTWVSLNDPNLDGNYSGNVNPGNGPGGPIPKGDYQINLIPEGLNGTLGSIVTTRVTINDNGTAPTDNTPPVIAILNPLSGSIVNGTVNLDAYGDDDQGLQSLQLFVDGMSVANKTMPTTYPYPDIVDAWNSTQTTNGLHVVTAETKDNAGLTTNASITMFVNNTSPASPFVAGYVPSVLIGTSILTIAVAIIGMRKKLVVR